MRFLGLSIAVLASAAWIVIADDELKIDVTRKVDCERKTKQGDNIAVHYKGTLTDGKVFDSSFDRGQPISFVVGTGRVIKGLDCLIYSPELHVSNITY
jgi:FK506-binding protein 2